MNPKFYPPSAMSSSSRYEEGELYNELKQFMASQENKLKQFIIDQDVKHQTLLSAMDKLQNKIEAIAQGRYKGKGSHQESSDEEEEIPEMTLTEKRLTEKLHKMEEYMRNFKQNEDIVGFDNLSLFPQARLPPNFTIPKLDKFDGTGCPKTHLKMYVRSMQPQGVTDELLAQLFQQTLKGSALRWFLNLEEKKIQTWSDICVEFVRQYQYNNEIDITLRDLETTRQQSKETFSAFITRWRAKASQMAKRPSEEEQIQLVLRNLLPTYNSHLFAHYFPSFKALIGAGSQIEDAINSGINNEEEIQMEEDYMFTTQSTEDLQCDEEFEEL